MGPDNFRNIKAEKAKAIQRFRRMQMITAAFRFVEFCMFLGIVYRVSAHLNVVAFKLSGEYFRGLSVALISTPRFVFVVGNAIFIILFLQSGHSPVEKHGSAGDGKVDFYEEYMKQSGNKNQNFYSNYNEEIKKQVKHTACTYYAKERRMQRSQSENLKRLNCGEEAPPGRELRRSATFVSRRKIEVATEEMSSEDFRRKVEDFIARQQRALREEEFSVFGST